VQKVVNSFILHCLYSNYSFSPDGECCVQEENGWKKCKPFTGKGELLGIGLVQVDKNQRDVLSSPN
jgi:hypothetical protein